MPEGPSMVILKEEVVEFTGQTILQVGGNTTAPVKALKGKKLLEFKTWGKHFLIRVKGFSVRIHFLLFGSYSINKKEKRKKTRLYLRIPNGTIYFYTCSVKIIEEDLDEVYDWSADVMSDEWDERKARKKLKQNSGMIAADALLDQDIFSGSGNIIKNEVLFRTAIHPASVISKIPPRKLTEMIREVRNYSFDFLEWKKAYVLRKHWLAHTKKTCPRCKGPILKEYMGKGMRRSFFCNNCQKKYI